MNYFTAGIYGDYKAYEKMKRLLGKEDKLWILGDVLDGNDEHPEMCIRILEDIMQSENVSLVLGDHEYFHAMRLFSELEGDEDDGEEEDIWTNEIYNCEYSGGPLVEYIKNTLSQSEKEDIANYLSSLDVSDLCIINGRLFYLCHGAPSMMEERESQWQYKIVTGRIDFYKSYGRDMGSDIRFPYFSKYYGIRRSDLENAIIISGQDFTPQLENEGEDVEDGIVFNNKIMCINSGASANNGQPHIVVGIDAAGWQTFEVGGN